MSASRDRLQQESAKKIGTVLDSKYRLDALLGFGAAGAVFRATNTWSGREFAVKVLHGDGEGEEATLQRFVREAPVTNRVQRGGVPHPNVVACIDVGRDLAAGVFIVQEYLRGETLFDLLQRVPQRRMSLSDAAPLVLPVVDAIACAHEAGVVHRDLKPENIFLAETPEGVVPKVLDFGIAQLADSRVTRSLEIMGTPSYMAPEAFVQAKEVDARADVWGIGVMLYEIVSGRVPFGEDATTLVAVLYQIASQEPASLLDQGLLGSSTWAVIRRCLEREPARRYADARALQAALTDVLPTL